VTHSDVSLVHCCPRTLDAKGCEKFIATACLNYDDYPSVFSPTRIGALTFVWYAVPQDFLIRRRGHSFHCLRKLIMNVNSNRSAAPYCVTHVYADDLLSGYSYMHCNTLPAKLKIYRTPTTNTAPLITTSSTQTAPTPTLADAPPSSLNVGAIAGGVVGGLGEWKRLGRTVAPATVQCLICFGSSHLSRCVGRFLYSPHDPRSTAKEAVTGHGDVPSTLLHAPRA
jgi:hypothetical protein